MLLTQIFGFQSGFNATGASTQISLVSMRWLGQVLKFKFLVRVLVMEQLMLINQIYW
jgi:hypothetical protein